MRVDGVRLGERRVIKDVCMDRGDFGERGMECMHELSRFGGEYQGEQ